MSRRYVVRPISDRTWLGVAWKEATRFSAKWGSTEDLLLAELEALDARDVVLELDVREQDLRIDGTLRANARPTSDAVSVAFESRHGPLIYRCDRFYATYAWQPPGWTHNARAIALTLQALRAVDRYGATAAGQQYTGFKALPAGRAMPASHMTSDQAFAVLHRISGSKPEDGCTAAELHRLARPRAHPDRNDGSRDLWDEVEQAAAVLGLLS